nr:MAG TPA: hypothetical protein [Caudoviricetes sp.]
MAFNEELPRVRSPRIYRLSKPTDRQLTQQEIKSFLDILYLELQLHEGRKCGRYIATDSYIEIIFDELVGNGSLDIFDVFSDITKLLLTSSKSEK